MNFIVAIRPFIYLLFIFSFTSNIFAQSNFKSEADLKKKADELFLQGEYVQAYPLYSQLLSLYPKDYFYNFRYGACVIYAEKEKEKAIKYLEYAVSNKDIDVEAYFFLGKAYHINYRFDDAINAYSTFKSKAGNKKRKLLNPEREIEMCENGKKLLSNLTDIIVIEKKEVPRSDFFRSYETSKFAGKILAKPDELKSSYDKKVKESSIIFVPNTAGGEIFYSSYGVNNKNGKDIFKVKRLPNGEFSPPQNVGFPINTPYDEEYPVLHPSGKILYFCSKGHNSMGGYDVFKSTFDDATQTWSTPVNLDFAINTPDDDILFIADENNEEAYFSSTRASIGSNIGVYKILLVRKPVDFVTIKGNFKHFKDDYEKGVKISVRTLNDNVEIASVTTDAESGDYLINIPKGVKYNFIIEGEGFATQSGTVEIPNMENPRPLKQEMELVNINGEARLMIKNLFDEEVTDFSYQLPIDVIRKKARLDVNYNEEEVKKLKEKQALSQATASNDKNTGNNTVQADDTTIKTFELPSALSNEQLIEMANSDVEDLKNEAAALREEADFAYAFAKRKSEESRNSLSPESEQYAKEAVLAYNLAIEIDNQASAKEREAQIAEKYAADIEKAIKNNSNKEALAILEKQRQELYNDKKEEQGAKGVLATMREKAIKKRAEAEQYEIKYRETKEDLEAIQIEITAKETEITKTKDDAHKEILKEDLNNLKTEYEAVNKQLNHFLSRSIELKKEAENIEYDIELLTRFNEIYKNEAENASYADLSNEEKADLKNDITLLESKAKQAEERKLEAESSIFTNSQSIAQQNNASKNTLAENKPFKHNHLNEDGTIADYNTAYLDDLDKITFIDNELEKYSTIATINNNWANTIEAEIVYRKENLSKLNKKQKKAELKKITELELQRDEKRKAASEAQAKVQELYAASTQKINETTSNALADNLQLEQTDKQKTLIDEEDEDEEDEEENTNTEATSTQINTNNTQAVTTTQTTSQSQAQTSNEAAVQQTTQVKQKVEENVEDDSAKDNVEDNVEDNIEDNLDDNVDDNIKDDSAKNNVNDNLDDNADNNAFDNVEDIIEENTDDNEEDNTEDNVEKENEAPSTIVDNTSLAQTNTTQQSIASPNVSSLVFTKQEYAFAAAQSENKRSQVYALEAESLSRRAQKIRDDALNMSSEEERRAAFKQADEFDKKAEEKKEESALAAAKANQIEYLNLESAISNTALKITDVNTPEVDIASLLREEAQYYFNEAKQIREKGLNAPNYTSKLNALERANIIEKDAIEKQQRSLELYAKAANISVEQALALNGATTATSVQTQTAMSNPAATSNKTLTNQTVVQTSITNSQASNLVSNKNATSNSQASLNNYQQQQAINQQIVELEKQIDEQQKIIDALEEEANELEKEVADLKKKVDETKKKKDKAIAEELYRAKNEEAIAKRNEVLNEKDNLEKLQEELSVLKSQDTIAITQNNQNAKPLAQNNSQNKVEEEEEEEEKIEEIEENEENEENEEIIDDAFNLSKPITNENSVLNNVPTNATTNPQAIVVNTNKQLSASEAEIVGKSPEWNQYYSLLSNADAAQRRAETDKQEATQLRKDAFALNQKAEELNEKAEDIEDEDEKEVVLANAKQIEEQANAKLAQADAKENSSKQNEILSVELQKQAESYLQSQNKETQENLIAYSKLQKTADVPVNQPLASTNTNTNTNNNVSSLTVNNQANVNNTTNINQTVRPAATNTATSSTVFSKKYEIPKQLNQEIFDRTNEVVYNESNPIPVDVELPEGLIFKVQVGAFRNKIPQDLFKGFAPITGETTPNGITRYTAGFFKAFETADLAKEVIKGFGYKDAFVVAFFNGKRISINEARQILKNQSTPTQVITQQTTIQNNVQTTNQQIQPETKNNQTTIIANEPAVNNISATEPLLINEPATAPYRMVEQMQGLFYTVQCGVYTRPVSPAQLYNIQPLLVEKTSNGMLRYTSGVYNELNTAIQAKNKIVGYGIKDAFVTAYYNGKRISIAEAKAIESSSGKGAFVNSSDMNKMPYQATNTVVSENRNITVNNPIVTTQQATNSQTNLDNTSATNTSKKPVTVKGLQTGTTQNIDASKPVYKVQIGAFKEEVPIDLAVIYMRLASKGISYRLREDGFTVYTVGATNSIEEANRLKQEVINEGITDAFLVAFQNDKQIPIIGTINNNNTEIKVINPVKEEENADEQIENDE